MSLEIALRTHLLDNTSIPAIVNQRVLFGDVGEDQSELPHIVFRADDSDWQGTLSGEKVDLQFPVFEFEVRAEDPGNLATLSNLIRRSLSELELGASITTNVGVEIIESVEIIDGGTDLPSKQITRDDNTIEVLRRSVLASVGYRFDTSVVS